MTTAVGDLVNLLNGLLQCSPQEWAHCWVLRYTTINSRT